MNQIFTSLDMTWVYNMAYVMNCLFTVDLVVSSVFTSIAKFKQVVHVYHCIEL